MSVPGGALVAVPLGEHRFRNFLPARVLVIRHCLPELVSAEAEQDGHIHDLLLLRRAIKLLQVHIEC